MQFGISDFLKQPPGSKTTLELKEDLTEESFPEVKFSSPVLAKVNLTRIEEGILADFVIKGKVELICDRCLSNFKQKIKNQFSQRYILENFSPKDIISQEEKQEGFVIDQKNRVDFKEALRQGILISLPQKKLCHEDCQGLCPNCGQNLNLVISEFAKFRNNTGAQSADVQKCNCLKEKKSKKLKEFLF